jgi:hypothetical protein
MCKQNKNENKCQLDEISEQNGKAERLDVSEG